MRAVISVVGCDAVGIIAQVSKGCADCGVNILDISQTILQGSFTMVMAVDVAASAKPIAELSALLDELGKKMGISIRIQRQEIFDAMHRI